MTLERILELAIQGQELMWERARQRETAFDRAELDALVELRSDLLERSVICASGVQRTVLSRDAVLRLWTGKEKRGIYA